MPGLPALRQAIAGKLETSRSVSVNPDSEIRVTVGATQALFTAIAAALHAGEEAILLDPSYDGYAPSILAQGAVPVRIARHAPDLTVDWNAVERAVTRRTRLIIVNNPNNPGRSVCARADLDALAAIAEGHDLLVLADEVYEHLIFDGLEHQSVMTYPALRARGFAVYSSGKTFDVTGWKVGYCIAPPALTIEFRKLHQFLVFSVNTPAQHALAQHLATAHHWQGQPEFFRRKHDRFARGLVSAGFKVLPSRAPTFNSRITRRFDPIWMT